MQHEGVAMKNVVRGFCLTASLAFATSASAETLVYLAEAADVSILMASPTQTEVIISYDSATWGAITSATLSVLLSDDHGRGDGNDRASITTVEGGSVDFQVVEGARPSWQHKTFDVTNYLADGALSFFLAAADGDFYYHNARLTVNFSPLSPVPEAGSTVLLASGLALVGLLARRRFWR
jgi:hypothetical protein